MNECSALQTFLLFYFRFSNLPGKITNMKEHVDSPCANVKQNKWPRLPILTAEMESSSAESEGSCGYDPDSESDDEDDESSR